MAVAAYDKKEIGRRLRTKRLEARKDQKDVAKAVGVSVSTIGMYERGERIPREQTKIDLANYYGVDVQSLFF